MFKETQVIQSSDENVKKIVFTKDDAVAEAVLYKYPTYEERTVICCSTQSGCPIGCRFCGAGDSFVRSLTGDEIIYQVDFALKETGVDPSSIKKLQVMFMSMGEPMLNMKNLEYALRVLWVKYPHSRLLISTSGPAVNYTPFMELAKEIDTIGLQFSVHESTDEKRNELIPFKDKLNLVQISDVGERFFIETGRKPFFNYCSHDKNTSDEDVERLLNLFDPIIWEATISVICERDEHIAAANKRQEMLAANFTSKLLEAGYNTRMFNPAGQDDIGGGCGQLHYVQDWFKNNPDKARPSIGRGMPVVHMPIEEKICTCSNCGNNCH